MDDDHNKLDEGATLQELFEHAIGLSARRRRALIEQISKADPEVADELKLLIQASASGDELKPMVRFDISLPPMTGVVRAFEDNESVRTPVGKGKVIRLLSSAHRIGQTEVYEVLLDNGNRRVALKVLRSEVSAGDLGRRFRVEAHTHAMLDHPGIASLLGAGAASGDSGTTHPAIVTAFVEGKSFDQWVLSGQTNGDIARAIIEIAKSVHHANIRGIVHRDLKPQNIMVDTEDRFRILDLGIAKLTEAAQATAGQSLVSISETVVGTPRYMAPEQFTPTTQQVDLLADVYALGCILYESLVGKPPIDTGGLSMVETADAKRNVRVTLPKISGVPIDLLQCAVSACASRRADRYESCHALAIDIERAINGLPLILKPPTPSRRLWLLMRRRPMMTALVLLLIVTATSFGVVYIGLQQRVAQQRDRAIQRFDESRLFANWVIFDLDRMLSSLPGTGEARRELINRANETLGALTTDPEADDDLLIEIIDARLRLSDVLVWELGNADQGSEQLDGAMALLDRLGDPNSPGAQIRKEWIRHCKTYSSDIDYGDILEGINMKAIQVFEQFEAEFSEYAPYWRWRADAEWKGTRRLFDRNASATEILNMGRAAIVHADRSVEIDPGDSFNQAEAANTRFWLALAMFELNDPRALTNVDAAIESAQALVETKHRMGLSLFARAKDLRGELLVADNQLEAGLSTMTEASKIHQAAIDSDPGNKSIYRRSEICNANLAQTYLLASKRGYSGSVEAGLKHVRAALQHLDHRNVMKWINFSEVGYRDEYIKLEQELISAGVNEGVQKP